jgi:hypothetical protein
MSFSSHKNVGEPLRISFRYNANTRHSTSTIAEFLRQFILIIVEEFFIS